MVFRFEVADAARNVRAGNRQRPRQSYHHGDVHAAVSPAPGAARDRADSPVRLRRILIALAIVILLPVALVAAAVLFAQSEWAERWLETRISQRIEREVQIEAMGIDLGWPPVVKFERLRIGNPSWARRGT